MNNSDQKQPHDGPQSNIPLDVRIRLAHGMVDHVLSTAGINALHFKGYAAANIFPAGRTSTDVDVIVDPTHQRAALTALENAGWTLVTSYTQGSIFQHAASLWHHHLGYVDVHRMVPGFSATPQEVFDILWPQRTTVHIAHYPCPSPAALDHILLILLHTARDPHRGIHDASTIWATLDDTDKKHLRRRVLTLGAETPWKVATNEDLGAHPDQVRLWTVLQRGADRTTLLHARMHAAHNLVDKTRLIASALTVNRGHLRISLGRTPTACDYAAEYRARIASALHRQGPAS